MGFIKKKNEDFFIDNGKILLSKNYLEKNKWRFKKITGSRFSSVIGESKYNTPLKMWCIIVGIYQDVMDPFLMDIGTLIEPKITEYAKEKMKTDFLVYDARSIKWDVFQENKIFGGIPDGEPVNSEGIFDYPNNPMLEIKTTSIDSFKYKKFGINFILEKNSQNIPIVKKKNGNLKKWFIDGKINIPVEYIYQLSLYLYLRKINKGIFFVAFLKDSDYANPQNYTTKDSLIEACELNIDDNLFRFKIEQATKWYQTHVNQGISPDISKEDNEFLSELDNEQSN